MFQPVRWNTRVDDNSVRIYELVRHYFSLVNFKGPGTLLIELFFTPAPRKHDFPSNVTVYTLKTLNTDDPTVCCTIFLMSPCNLYSILDLINIFLKFQLYSRGVILKKNPLRVLWFPNCGEAHSCGPWLIQKKKNIYIYLLQKPNLSEGRILVLLGCVLFFSCL